MGKRTGQELRRTTREKSIANPIRLYVINKNKKKKNRNKRKNRNRNNNNKKKNHAPLSKDPVIVNSGASSCRHALDHETIAIEILSRLHVKTLMRFKCVCKHWLSFIEDDPYFIDVHLTRSNKARPGLFTAVPLYRQLPDYEIEDTDERLLLTADLLHDCNRPAELNTMRKTKSLCWDTILGPVNGLICFLDLSVYAVQIYNVSTREVTPWIASPVRMKAERKPADGYSHDVEGGAECQFGFDPVTKEHKVVLVWDMSVEITNKSIVNRRTRRRKRIIEEYHVCEVLTVGDNTWRIIDEYPPFPFDKYSGKSAYANGSIYWYTRGYSVSGGNIIQLNDDLNEEEGDPTEFLVVFDIGSEKFRRIPIPIPGFKNVHLYRINLVEVDGGMAILRTVGQDHCIAKMWMFYDYDKKVNGSTTTPNSKKLWSNAVTITFPFDVVWGHRFNFHSITGTDQIIIETNTGPKRRQGDVVKKKIPTFALPWIYSYTWKTNTMTEVDIDGIAPSVPAESSEFDHFFWTTFVESLLPVQKKLQPHHIGAHPPQAKFDSWSIGY